MKGGHKPVHIMRWAPGDYVNDPFVMYLYRHRKYTVIAFYSMFLFRSHMEGGSLSSDPDRLAATLLMPRQDVVSALSLCLSERKLVESEGRLYHRRVAAQIAQELEFRELQRKHGKEGGRGNKKASLLDSKNPPAPLPAPAPLLPIPIPECESTPLNRSILALVDELVKLTGKDPTEVLKAHSMIPPRAPGGKPNWITSLDSATEKWRIRTMEDMRAEVSRLKVQGKPPTVPPWMKKTKLAAELEKSSDGTQG